MRIHSDILSVFTIEQALRNAQSDGRTGKAVSFAVLTEHGSRSRSNAFEVQLGSSTCDSFKSAGVDDMGYPDKAAKRSTRRRSRQWSAGDKSELSYAPTWHEWGHFIAELFIVDPNAIVGVYEGEDSFEYQTSVWGQQPIRMEYAFNWNGRAYNFMEDAARFKMNNI